MATRSSAIHTARQFAALGALAFLAACSGDIGLTAPGRSDARLAALQPPAHYPIIFVHGYNASTSTWSTMYNRFIADGYTSAELVNWSYDYKQSNATTAALIGKKVDSVIAATGAYHVDIITHSMGALSARYYVRNLLPLGDTRVDAVVTLGGTNHGTTTAFACAPISCVEMRTYSSFVTKLNSTDETWGAPRYATWWSACDEVIYPQKSAILSGAVNTQTACLRHSDLHENATVYGQVRDFLKQTQLVM
jgi:triacylglycerol lipase